MLVCTSSNKQYHYKRMNTQNNDNFIELSGKKSIGYWCFWALLPFLGIHRFMIGKPVSGWGLILIGLPISIAAFCIMKNLDMDTWFCIFFAYIAAWSSSAIVDLLEIYEETRAISQNYKRIEQAKDNLVKELGEGKITREEYDTRREEYDARQSRAKKIMIIGFIIIIVYTVIEFVVLP